MAITDILLILELISCFIYFFFFAISYIYKGYGQDFSFCYLCFTWSQNMTICVVRISLFRAIPSQCPI